MSLTAPERETVITFSDEDDTATVHTHQRRIITKLRNNPAATELEDISFDGTAGAVFQLPVWAISFLDKETEGQSQGGRTPYERPTSPRTACRNDEIWLRSGLITDPWPVTQPRWNPNRGVSEA
jgi:hypothetical protein